MEAGYPPPPSRPPQTGLTPPELYLPPGFQLPQLQPIQLSGLQQLPQPTPLMGLSQFGQVPVPGILSPLGLPVTLPGMTRAGPPPRRSTQYVSSSGRLAPSPPFALPETSLFVASRAPSLLPPSPSLLAPSIARPPSPRAPTLMQPPPFGLPLPLPRASRNFEAQLADLLAERYPDIFEELVAEIEVEQGFEEEAFGDF